MEIGKLGAIYAMFTNGIWNLAAKTTFEDIYPTLLM